MIIHQTNILDNTYSIVTVVSNSNGVQYVTVTVKNNETDAKMGGERREYVGDARELHRDKVQSCIETFEKTLGWEPRIVEDSTVTYESLCSGFGSF